MAKKSDKYENSKLLTLPACKFGWVRLNEPDTNFKEGGEYYVTVRYEKDSEEFAFIDRAVEEMMPIALAEAEQRWSEMKVDARKAIKKKTGAEGPTRVEWYKEEYDEDTEELLSTVSRRCVMPASGTYKSGKREGEIWTAKPMLWDAGSPPKRMDPPPPVWAGTLGKVQVELRPFWFPADASYGVSFRLRAVQVIDLVTGGGATAEECGFGAEEGGFVYEKPANGAAHKSKASKEAEEDDDDSAEETNF